ncbi:hypothetical protein PLESTB_000781800 [Pleodorina starrii]|uniref:ASCH domain-containing protein n=1 Tax=Pleodorina starrii TaxID=330485 RepID=A0A9W6BLS2_9CHLO|nr:hypothetical protein PLESTM_000503100 [Pleodorina starrii]GLC53736.1 hypothetical protein PLESTB_000781800 [Pleodorina starrii]
MSEPSTTEGAAAAPPAPGGAAPRPPLFRDSSLMPTYLELIRSGAKTVEGRIRAGKWADVIPGDTFRFVSTTDAGVSVCCRATSVRQYDSFRAMLEGEGLQACLPGVSEVAQGVEVYRSIPGYREREAAEGVVAVGLQLLPPQEEEEGQEEQ